MSEQAKCVWTIGILWIAGAMVGQVVIADVLVTKSGSRYKGTVVDKGDSYLLIKPSGGKMTLPKSMVREVIKEAGSGASTGGAGAKVGAEVRQALQPLRAKILASKQAIGKAVKEAVARHKQECADAISPGDQKAISDAEEHLKLIRSLAAGLGKRPPGPPTPGIRNEVAVASSVEIKMPDGTIKTIFITPRNKASVVSKAQAMVFAAGRRAQTNAAKKLGPRHRKELAKYQALRAKLAKAESRLKAAAAAMAPVQNDAEKVAAGVQKCAKQLDESLTTIAKELKHIPVLGEASESANRPDERGKLIAALVAKGDRLAKRDVQAAQTLYHLASVYAPDDEDIRAKKKALEGKGSATITSAQQKHFFRLVKYLHPDVYRHWPTSTQSMELVELKLLSEQGLVGRYHWGWIRMEGQEGLKARFFSFSPTVNTNRIATKYGQPSSQKKHGGTTVLTYGRIRLIASGSGRIVGVLYNDPSRSQ